MKLEVALPARDDGRARRCEELIGSLSSCERDALKQALRNLKDGADRPKDYATVRSILDLAQERLDVGAITAGPGNAGAPGGEKLRSAL